MAICSICKEKETRKGPIYPFPQLLKEMGIEGRMAHPSCVSNEKQVRIEYKSKYGEDMAPPGRRLI